MKIYTLTLLVVDFMRHFAVISLASNYAFIQGRFVGFLEQQRRSGRPGSQE